MLLYDLVFLCGVHVYVLLYVFPYVVFMCCMFTCDYGVFTYGVFPMTCVCVGVARMVSIW